MFQSDRVINVDLPKLKINATQVAVPVYDSFDFLEFKRRYVSILDFGLHTQ